MAYADKYYGSFKDYFDRTVLVTIQERNYSGSSTEMKLAGAVVEYNGSDSEVYNPVMSSSLTVNVVSETNFQYIDLYSSDATNFKVIVTIGGSLYWQGFIIPDLFTEPYTNTPYISQIVATDGLKGLESKDFKLTGVKSQYQIIEYCLRQIYPDSLQTYFYEALNTYEENHDYTTADSPLLQTYNDCDRFVDFNCYDVLQSYLDLYGARIYQKNGAFWIVSIHEFKSELNYRYHAATVSSGTVDPEKLIGYSQTDKLANVNHDLNILPGWKEFNINIDLLKKESFISNWDFSDWTKTGYVTVRNPIYEPDNWIGTAPVRRSVGTTQFMYFTSNYSSPTSVFRANITSSGWVESDRSLLFNVKFGILQDRVAPNNEGQFWIKIELFDADSSAISFLNDLGGWESSETFINIENIEQSKQWNFEDLSIISDGIPHSGYVAVYIYPSDSGSLGISEFKGEVLSSDLIEYPETTEYNKPVNLNNNFIPSDLDLNVADFPDFDNQDTTNPTDDVIVEQFVYEGGTFLDSGRTEPTTQWQTREQIAIDTFTTADQLHKIISKQKEFLSVPQWAITGDLLSQTLTSDSCIVDYSIGAKKYLFSNGEFNLQSSQVSGTFIEIGTYSGGEWILEDGVWNDAGIWIDSETWNDS